MKNKNYKTALLAAAAVSMLSTLPAEAYPPDWTRPPKPEQDPADAAEQLNRAERRRRARALKKANR